MSNLGILWLTIVNQKSPIKELYNSANHLHVTLKFNVSINQVSGYLNKSVKATILENCWNDKIQALKIKLPVIWSGLCKNKHPHMTISHKGGVKPYMSNAMLEGKHEKEIINKNITLLSEFYMFDIKEK